MPSSKTRRMGSSRIPCASSVTGKSADPQHKEDCRPGLREKVGILRCQAGQARQASQRQQKKKRCLDFLVGAAELLHIPCYDIPFDMKRQRWSWLGDLRQRGTSYTVLADSHDAGARLSNKLPELRRNRGPQLVKVHVCVLLKIAVPLPTPEKQRSINAKVDKSEDSLCRA